MTDPQDPLPESHWLYRRIYTWVTTVVALILIAVCVTRAPDPTNLGLALCVLIGWMATLYLVAPSAEVIARIVAWIARIRRG